MSTTVHNMIVGKLWLDNHGEMEIVNHKTGDKCCLKFIPYSYFSREIPKKVRRRESQREKEAGLVEADTVFRFLNFLVSLFFFFFVSLGLLFKKGMSFAVI